MFRKFTVLILLLVSVLAFSEDHLRKSWYIGFGVGTFFDASWTTNGAENTWDNFYSGTTTTPPISINFKVGGTLNPNVLFGFDITAIREEGTATGLKATTQINNYFAMFTWFPFREGFFMRLGGGFSNFQLTIDSTLVGNGSSQYNGYGALAGIGYAFWLGRQFNLTLNLDYSMQWYTTAGGPDTSKFMILYMGFDWY